MRFATLATLAAVSALPGAHANLQELFPWGGGGGSCEECQPEIDELKERLDAIATSLTTMVVNFGALASIGLSSTWTGVGVRAPNGLRLLNPDQSAPARLLFGPSDECRLEIDPQGGMQLRDPSGVRVLNSTSGGTSRLSIGEGQCFLEAGPGRAMTVGEPNGVRLINPTDNSPGSLIFGPDDDCFITADTTRGMRLYDIVAVVICRPGGRPGGTLIFGDGDQCRIDADPDDGMTLSDPRGVRLVNSTDSSPGRLIFGPPGPSDQCFITAVPGSGMRLYDVVGIVICRPGGAVGGTLIFGNQNDQCRIDADPSAGMQLRDPVGVRVLDPRDVPGRLIFNPFDPSGAADTCFITAGPGGMRLYDIVGIVICRPGGAVGGTLIFGDQNDQCRIDAGEGTGMQLRDPVGVRVLDPTNMPGRLIFNPFDPSGAADTCFITAVPGNGMILYDIVGIVICRPNGQPGGTLVLGTDDRCSIDGDPDTGMTLSDPRGVRVRAPVLDDRENPGGLNNAPIIRFGDTTDECSIGIDQAAEANRVSGLLLRDVCIRIIDPTTGENPGTIYFGMTDDCSIGVMNLGDPLTFSDPNGFNFVTGTDAPAMFDGEVIADNLSSSSSRRLKEKIRTMVDAKEKIGLLRGVYFDWKKSGKADLGFIAEEVAEVFPEATTFDSDGKATAVKYSNLVAVAVEAVKAQQEEIDEHKKEIEELKQVIEELKQVNDEQKKENDEQKKENDAVKKQQAAILEDLKQLKLQMMKGV